MGTRVLLCYTLGTERRSAICVTDENPQVLVSALEKIKDSSEQQMHYAKQSKIAAQTEFNPCIIQNEFLKSLQSLIN